VNTPLDCDLLGGMIWGREGKRLEELKGEVGVVSCKGFEGNFGMDQRVKFMKVFD